MRTWRAASLLAVILLLVSAGLVVAATTTTLLGYQIDFLGFTDNGNNTSTWTYAVTSDGDEEKGLSHWSLDINACFGPIVAPANSTHFTTKTGAEFGCGTTYNCEVAQCTVVQGIDPTTGHYYDDTKRYIEDTVNLNEDERFQVYEGNARRVFTRLDAALKKKGL